MIETADGIIDLKTQFLSMLRFFGCVPVRIPAATFQFKGAGRDYFLGRLLALGAFDGLGAHLDKFFSYRSFVTFEFIYRHV